MRGKARRLRGKNANTLCAAACDTHSKSFEVSSWRGGKNIVGWSGVGDLIVFTLDRKYNDFRYIVDFFQALTTFLLMFFVQLIQRPIFRSLDMYF